MTVSLQHTLLHTIDIEQRLALYQRQLRADTAQTNLSTAENALLFDFYQQHLFDWSARAPITENNLRYPASIYGGPVFQSSWAEFLNTAWGETLAAPEDIYAVGGTSAALECLAFILGQPGDTVICPAPLWYGFPWSFTQRPKLKFAPFDMVSAGLENFTLTLEDVQAAYRSHATPPKFLVLTNPNNPTGGNHPASALNAIYEWVLRDTDMHIISDEIYFLSQVGDGEPFVPAFALDAVKQAGETGKQRVHTVWGLAKDFGMSGFKVGFVISRNPTVQQLMKGNGDYKAMPWFTPFDSLKQFTLGPLFLNAQGEASPALAQDAMRQYAGPEASALLKRQYQATRQALDEGQIAYYPHNQGAIFFWLDLRAYLDKVPPTTQHAVHDAAPLRLSNQIDPREEALLQYILNTAGVSLIPGQECYCRDPGYYRMCYTAQALEDVVGGVNRMAQALAQLG